MSFENFMEKTDMRVALAQTYEELLPLIQETGPLGKNNLQLIYEEIMRYWNINKKDNKVFPSRFNNIQNKKVLTRNKKEVVTDYIKNH